MTKLHFLTTTTLGGQRYAKGDVTRVDDATARDLVALGKAEIVKEQKPAKEPRPAPSVSGKAEHKI